jgi:hypothetical protein
MAAGMVESFLGSRNPAPPGGSETRMPPTPLLNTLAGPATQAFDHDTNALAAAGRGNVPPLNTEPFPARPASC